MKNITKSLIALLALVAISCSVEDVQDRPVIEGIDSPVLTAPLAGSAYVLSPANADSQIERFTWKSANYGGDVEVTYTVEVDSKGNSFKTPQELGTVKSANQVSVSVAKLNGAALALKAAPFVAADFEVRVKSTVATNVMYSNVAGIVITPYTTETPKLWLPGGYQNASGYGADWAHSSAPTLLAEGYGKTAFEGYVYFATAQDGTQDGKGFKLSTQANWDGTNYGVGATAGTISTTGGNLSIAAPGYYKIKADTDPAKLTYSATKLSWGIVGNATPGGWDADTPMAYNPATKKWTITVVLTAQSAPDNGLKFRANNSWDFNFGDTGADGKLEDGGTNIGTTAGTFLITLDLSNPRNYTYTMVKQ
ncbi:SusE domain-containing protein [Flavobacterium sp. MDT1-60]|uniref:SusE domain-containing protein n=1 Tax=Flavobacterium sp. MDT1-60 TaxID=1979344 RepID=UPI0017846DC2|nr:SusE domain-containing protein [Flavobacterium sp. MDT1-60]QOG02786.1 SusE domain-containing protein [Flavobacterium sp. MDT1-60]